MSYFEGWAYFRGQWRAHYVRHCVSLCAGKLFVRSRAGYQLPGVTHCCKTCVRKVRRLIAQELLTPDALPPNAAPPAPVQEAFAFPEARA